MSALNGNAQVAVIGAGAMGAGIAQVADHAHRHRATRQDPHQTGAIAAPLVRGLFIGDMAAHQLAEMQIAAARAQQSASRLDMIRYQLEHAQVRAPYAGVVIEGDLKKNLGAPVRKGDLLLKLAQNSDTYVEVEIDDELMKILRAGKAAVFALRESADQDRVGIPIELAGFGEGYDKLP